MNTDTLHDLAQEIVSLLQQTGRQLVCAESCTAGLVAASIGGIPGASNHFCGSAVVYRNETKVHWLGVSQAVLSDPQLGDVCEETALQMAQGVLALTPSASVSASVTGHLGPGSPPGLDGVVYAGWAERSLTSPTEITVRCQRLELQEPAPRDRHDVQRRVARQTESTQRVLLWIREALLQINARSELR